MVDHRSWDGLTLYAVSSDGTLAAFNFDLTELEGIAPHSAQEQYLSKFGFVQPAVPDEYSHVPKPETHSVSQAQLQQPSQSQPNGFGATGGSERVNVLVAKRAPKNKKRVTLTNSVASGSSIPSARVAPKRSSLMPIHSHASDFPSVDEQPFGDIDMVHIDSFVNDSYSSPPGKGKDKASDFDDVRYRTLGGDRSRNATSVQRLGSPSPWSGRTASNNPPLDPPPLLNIVTFEVDDNDVLEATNSKDDSEWYLFLQCVF